MSTRTSYRSNYKLTKRFGTSYFIANLLMQKKDRQHVYALYSLCRYADDIVDGNDGEKVDPETARIKLESFKSEIVSAITVNDHETPFIGAIAKTWNELELPLEYLERFFRSMEMDLSVSSYATYEDLLVYMDGSAAVIGEMVLPILEPDASRRDALVPCARALGNAFQLTNFLRDVGEDLKRGRIYIPEKDIAEFGLSSELTFGPDFQRLMKFEIRRAQELYDEAYPGVVGLSGRRGACVRTAYRLYGGINKEIEYNNYDVLAYRSRVPQKKKYLIAAREITRIRSRSMASDCYLETDNDR